MRKPDIDVAVSAAHERIANYVAGRANEAGDIPARKVVEIVDYAFAQLRDAIDLAAGMRPQR